MERMNCPVDMIFLCTSSGEIRPLRFRAPDWEGQPVRVDIEEILDEKQINYTGIEARIFVCRSKQGTFELKYTIRSHNWKLLRRIC